VGEAKLEGLVRLRRLELANLVEIGRIRIGRVERERVEDMLADKLAGAPPGPRQIRRVRADDDASGVDQQVWIGRSGEQRG
jgi:hypothetical protein